MSVASREDFFLKTSDEGAALTSKWIVEKFATKKMDGIINQGFKTLTRNYKVAVSMGGGGTEPLMPYAVKLPNGGTE